MNELNIFYDKLDKSLAEDSFVKITLSKPAFKSDGLHNVYIRYVVIKDTPNLSFTYHYQTNDQVKNYSIEEAKKIISDLLENKFRIITLFSLEEDFTLQFSKKGKVSTRTLAPSFSNKLPEAHDVPKKKRAALGKYLMLLGVTDEHGVVIPKMADKFKQINKFLEIVESLIKNSKFPKTVNIVDMGSGKGYLTFALYDYLVNQKKMEVNMVGVELREELVDFCNQCAKDCEFENLKFEKNSIQDYQNNNIDILIALHACDTATDDALAKGINANASIIITAPCCHKQIRQQLKGKEQENPMLKYGIFKERQFEMVTDTIRALILEEHQYNTNVFEFISNEHTRKNVMLVGQKSNKKPDEEKISSKIKELKSAFHIDFQQLEKLV